MNAKSEFERYLSSQTFYATSSEHIVIGLQLVGATAIPVNAISQFM